MKHLDFYAFAAAAAMILAAGCSKESTRQKENPDYDELTFTAVNNDTKSILSDGTKVLFQEYDSISLFSANNANKMLVTLNGTQSSGTATFLGSGKKGDAAYYTVYPYTASTALSSSKITGFSVPATQYPTKGTFDPDAPITFAKAAGTNLTFHNLCALLQIKMPEQLKEIKITVESDASTAAIAGNVDIIDIDSGGNLTPASGNTNKTVTLSDPSVIMETGEVYYIAIIPGTYKNINLVGKDKSGTTKIDPTRSASFVFEKGKIYDMNTIFTMTGTNDDFGKEDFYWE